MGHIRIGFLPHTKQWKAIIDQLSLFGDVVTSVAQISNETLKAVKNTYEAMQFDDSVVKALYFLATLYYSAKQENQIGFLNENGYNIYDKMSLLSLMSSVIANMVTLSRKNSNGLHCLCRVSTFRKPKPKKISAGWLRYVIQLHIPPDSLMQKFPTLYMLVSE